MRAWDGRRSRYVFLTLFLAALGILLWYLPGISADNLAGRTDYRAGEIIYVQPLGNIEAGKLKVIHDILGESFKKDVKILPKKTLSKQFRVAEKGQYSADLIMLWAEEQVPPDAFRFLTVVEEDIFSGRYNFIFGQARIRGKLATVSLYRFTDPSRPLAPGEKSFFRERIGKLVLHELGHTFGLQHCNNEDCVMAFANSMLELDRQSAEFCGDCLRKLGNMAVLNVLSGGNDTVIYTELAPDVEKQ
jgi:archaemetzincin